MPIIGGGVDGSLVIGIRENDRETEWEVWENLCREREREGERNRDWRDLGFDCCSATKHANQGVRSLSSINSLQSEKLVFLCYRFFSLLFYFFN